MNLSDKIREHHPCCGYTNPCVDQLPLWTLCLLFAETLHEVLLGAATQVSIIRRGWKREWILDHRSAAREGRRMEVWGNSLSIMVSTTFYIELRQLCPYWCVLCVAVILTCVCAGAQYVSWLWLRLLWLMIVLVFVISFLQMLGKELT